MLDNYNDRVLNILNEIKNYSLKNNIKKIGTEYLLLVMYDIPDSLCHFLFNEYNVDKEELEEEIINLHILRKDDNEYTEELIKLFQYASNIEDKNKISDEHLFLSILYTEECIAHNILIRLGFDINDLKNDVEEIYDFKSKPLEFSYTNNITKLCKENRINNYVNIEEYIERLLVILNRKNKNNPILIGNAGVGKTAIVEGLASYLIKNNINLEIISLNISSMLSGTKYRGDFEERLDNIVNEITSRKNICLFIDEIHTIVGAGTTESSLDVSNMLKPFLARSDFKVIGATTINEYNKTIKKDKALNRRFEAVFVKEPSLEDTKKILYGIKKDYEAYHNMKIKNNVLDYLIEISNKRIINKYRPDKCIDVLDELLSYNKLNNKKTITFENVDFIIDKMLGFKKDINKKLTFEILRKYQFYHNNDLIQSKILLNILYDGNKKGYLLLLEDLKTLFGITDEMILQLNMKNFTDPHSISSLIGTSQGYIGYEDEGILSKHIIDYPMVVITISNIEYASYNIKSLFYDIKENGYFYDKHSNYVNCNNVILITKEKEKQNKLGFNNNKNNDVLYDEIINYNIDFDSINSKYEKLFLKYNIEASIEFDASIYEKKLNEKVYEIIKNKTKDKIKLYLDNNEIKYK